MYRTAENRRRGACRPAARRLPAALVGMVAVAWVAPLQAASPVDFTRDVAPILVARCLECHGGTQPEGSLRLVDHDGLRRGGDTGPAIVPGASAASLLWQRVAADEMPPKHPLPAEEKDVLARWIDADAPWEGGALDLYSV
ncbi:MAG: c-type cytochrome domain-containing protein, partial [Planctomycetaceae bacterium]